MNEVSKLSFRSPPMFLQCSMTRSTRIRINLPSQIYGSVEGRTNPVEEPTHPPAYFCSSAIELNHEALAFNSSTVVVDALLNIAANPRQLVRSFEFEGVRKSLTPRNTSHSYSRFIIDQKTACRRTAPFSVSRAPVELSFEQL